MDSGLIQNLLNTKGYGLVCGPLSIQIGSRNRERKYPAKTKLNYQKNL